MRGLLLKIFLCFWLAIIGTGMAVLLADVKANREQQREQWRDVIDEVFGLYALSVAANHENPDTAPTSASTFLDALHKRTGIQAWLFDARGREVAAYARASRLRLPRSAEAQLRILVKRARAQHTDFKELGTVTLAAQAARLPNGHRYVLVGLVPTPVFSLWQAEPSVHFLRTLLILLVTGGVSWGLTRHLMRPVLALREASRRLSEGDLSARSNAPVRGDELADLARDFDQMAERIESLLHDKENLLQAQKRLLSDVSHELRSPLTRLGVALELARDSAGLSTDEGEGNSITPSLAHDDLLLTTCDSHPELAEALQRIEREAGQLDNLIGRLLKLSRLESGVQRAGEEWVELAPLVRAVATDAAFEAQARGRLVRITHCQDCTTQGTPELLQSAIENVVRNAVRYTAEGTSVEIALVCDAECRECQITVRDHGPGIPEDDLENVFRPFYRASGAPGTLRVQQGGGDGLGLAITARAIELHGGTVNAVNAPDGGLIVAMHLSRQVRD